MGTHHKVCGIIFLHGSWVPKINTLITECNGSHHKVRNVAHILHSP